MGAKQWTQAETIILLDGVRRFTHPNNTKTGDFIVRQIMEKTGRPEAGVRSKFYKEVTKVREGKKSKARAALKEAAVELTAVSIACRMAEIIQELNDLTQEIRTLEQWAEDTLNIKKHIEYRVDGQGVVERVNRTRSD